MELELHRDWLRCSPCRVAIGGRVPEVRRGSGFWTGCGTVGMMDWESYCIQTLQETDGGIIGNMSFTYQLHHA